MHIDIYWFLLVSEVAGIFLLYAILISYCKCCLYIFYWAPHLLLTVFKDPFEFLYLHFLLFFGFFSGRGNGPRAVHKSVSQCEGIEGLTLFQFVKPIQRIPLLFSLSEARENNALHMLKPRDCRLKSKRIILARREKRCEPAQRSPSLMSQPCADQWSSFLKCTETERKNSNEVKCS